MEQLRSSFKPLAFITGFLALWLLFAVASYQLLWVPNANRFDFYPRWMGARTVLEHGNPYTATLTREIQIGMFGQPRAADQDQQAFAYPAWLAWQLLPFWLLPFPLAVSLWCGLALLLCLSLPLAIYTLLGWRIPPLALAVVVFFSVFVFRYPMITFFFGQFIPFVLACCIAAWWSMAHRRQGLTALALILAMVRPEIALLPSGMLMLTAWTLHQRRVPLYWGGGMFCLWLVTRLWIGPWELDFYRGVLAYRVYAIPVWGPGLLNHPLATLLLVAGLVGWSVWLWFQIQRVAPVERIGWALALALLTSLILVPQTANYTLVMALGAVWFLFWSYRHNYAYWLPLLAVLTSPWFFSALKNNWNDWERLLIPLALCLLLTHSWLQQRNRRNQNIAQTQSAYA